jgi:hypothetical protein
MVACGTSGLLGGLLVVLLVADNSLMLFVPVFALGVVFLVVAFFASDLLVAGFLAADFAVVFFGLAMIILLNFDFHFLGKCCFLYIEIVPDAVCITI